MLPGAAATEQRHRVASAVPEFLLHGPGDPEPDEVAAQGREHPSPVGARSVHPRPTAQDLRAVTVAADSSAPSAGYFLMKVSWTHSSTLPITSLNPQALGLYAPTGDSSSAPSSNGNGGLCGPNRFCRAASVRLANPAPPAGSSPHG